MAHDEAALHRVRQFITGRPDVVEKRMVGGRSFIVGGHLCCGVTGSALMVRVGPERYAQALEGPHVRPMAFGRRHLIGYVCVDPPGYATDDALAAWLRHGLDFVATLNAGGSSSDPTSQADRGT